MFWFFGRKACGILAPRPGIEPAPPALEGKVLTTGPPGKSLQLILIGLVCKTHQDNGHKLHNMSLPSSFTLHGNVIICIGSLRIYLSPYQDIIR